MAVTTLRVKIGDRWYTVQVGDLSHSPVEVTVEGETFQVEVQDLRPSPPPAARRGRARSRQIAAPPPHRSPASAIPSDDVVRAPMAGKVIAILVRPGDRVSAGDNICVVEAMKMEQSIRAPRDGVVKTVHVQPMDSVGADDILIELE